MLSFLAVYIDVCIWIFNEVLLQYLIVRKTSNVLIVNFEGKRDVC